MDKALATSGGYGTIFDPKGEFNHLMNPYSGGTAPTMLGVTVVADTCTKANALSTPLTVVPAELRQKYVSAFGNVTAIFVTPEGVVETLQG